MSENLQRRDDARFQADMESVIKEAEDHRLYYMQKLRGRKFMSMALSLLFVLAGAGGFGWFLLMEANLPSAFLCMMAAIIPPVFLDLWTDGPVKAYRRDYKTGFMPKMAQALDGLEFYPGRGISAQLLPKTGIVPAHDRYSAEDCFMGVYKGVKIILSEARLFSRKKPVFRGIFVLMETASGMFEGHTILTADQAAADQWAATRWKKLQTVDIKTQNPHWNRFRIFSDNPESAALLIGEKLLKELSEAADIFDEASISVALFGGKYIFMMIPHQKDMFEASDIEFPVAIRKHALDCKKEIEQLFEVIDIFELYKAHPSGPFSG